jgi:FkbH-like protein
MLNEKVKLVIWDLDETFWKGTLSEEGVTWIPENEELIVELTQRGIVNSICSKNTFEEVKSILSSRGLWDSFVFPVIDWTPKGQAVKGIIEDMGLRAVNVVFIDDNVGNIEEVKYFNEGIMTLTPDKIMDLLNSPFAQGKPDTNGDRLKQYKDLQAKVSDKKAKGISNLDFLKQSQINVKIETPSASDLPRINELIERTNQLNFTKNRTLFGTISELFKGNAVAKKIHVRDKYGDYGLVGFVQIKDNKFIHFLFSCRTMNMRIENYVKNKFEGISEENFVRTIMEEHTDFISDTDIQYDKDNFKQSKSKSLFIGSCDLDQSVYYLNSKYMVTEFNSVSASNLDVRKDHTAMITQSINGYSQEQLSSMIGYDFLPKDMISRVIDQELDFIVISLLTDYSRNQYRHKKHGYTIAYEHFMLDLTDEESLNDWPSHLSEHKTELHQIFKRDFECIGPITPHDMKKNLEIIAEAVGPRPLLLINASELDIVWQENKENFSYTRHKELNDMVDSICADNMRIVDVRKFVKSRNDLTDNPRHYSKRVYNMIAEEIKEITSDVTDLELSSAIQKIYAKTLKKIRKFRA